MGQKTERGCKRHVRVGEEEAIVNYQHGFKYVCSCGDLETLKLMLQSFEGENFDRIINERGTNGHIAFIEACIQGKDEIVKLLLQRRAHVDQAACFSATPLHAASGQGHLEICHARRSVLRWAS